MASNSTSPKSVLIVGSGVFGLSTALALKTRPAYRNTSILVIEKSPFPAQDGSSVDSSRIARGDYADEAYCALYARARDFWRTQAEYSETGLVLVGDKDTDGGEYVSKSAENVTKIMGEKLEPLGDRESIRRKFGLGGASGSFGYYNAGSGWVHAENALVKLRERCAKAGVQFAHEKVVSVLFEGEKAVGVSTESGKKLSGDLVILAAGAWTPSILDLSSQVIATGQAVGYIELSEKEQERYGKMPVLLNFSSGTYILPPRNRILKVARHSLGYINTSKTSFGQASTPVTAVSHPGLEIPAEAKEALKLAIHEAFPELPKREFSRTRLCWYTDTRDGNFLATYHPQYRNLFLATGGSGHAFKFLPVLGEEVADIIEGRGAFKEQWAWKEGQASWVGDGSRGGLRGGEGELRKAGTLGKAKL